MRDDSKNPSDGVFHPIPSQKGLERRDSKHKGNIIGS